MTKNIRGARGAQGDIIVKALAAALLALAGAGAGYFALLHAPQAADLGAAAPKAGVGQVDFDWVLAEGELLQGTATLNVPQGINVSLKLDNDRPETLIIEGYDIEFPLAAERIVAVNFHSYRKGLFNIRLKSSPRSLGTLSVVEPQ